MNCDYNLFEFKGYVCVMVLYLLLYWIKGRDIGVFFNFFGVWGFVRYVIGLDGWFNIVI